MNTQDFQHRIQTSINTKAAILQNEQFLKNIETVYKLIANAFKTHKKVLFCGNGGSAADAQHLAAELSGRYYIDRAPLFAEALHVNTSYLTAVANDYSYNEIYARLVKAFGKKGDILVSLSTSGNSENIVKATLKAKELEMITIGMTGKCGGKLKNICDYLFNVPSTDTPRIQETHILIGHIICEAVEKNLFGPIK